MDQKIDIKAEPRPIVYVRAVQADELPDEIRARLPEGTPLFAVHDSDGQRLALVRDRSLAFVLARQNNLAPVNVH